MDLVARALVAAVAAGMLVPGLAAADEPTEQRSYVLGGTPVVVDLVAESLGGATFVVAPDFRTVRFLVADDTTPSLGGMVVWFEGGYGGGALRRDFFCDNGATLDVPAGAATAAVYVDAAWTNGQGSFPLCPGLNQGTKGVITMTVLA